MSRSSKNVKQWRHRTKERIVQSLGGQCCICGYNRCPGALAIHHLDPSTKEFGLGTVRASSVSWDKIVRELRKCILVCHNCHSEYHAGLIQIPVDAPRFDERFVNYHVDKDLLDNCPVCNEPKRISAITCSRSCAAKRKWRFDWTKINLASYYDQGLSQVAIGELLGVSDSAVLKRARKLGIKNKPNLVERVGNDPTTSCLRGKYSTN